MRPPLTDWHTASPADRRSILCTIPLGVAVLATAIAALIMEALL